MDIKEKEGRPGVDNLRYKAKLVANGFTQKEEIDYNEIFSSTARHSSIRLLLITTAFFDMHLEQLDVETAFLHG